MTSFEAAGHCLADIADAARRRRDSFVARNAQVALRLDRPLLTIARRPRRAVLNPGAALTVGTGLEAAFRADWFPPEAWGAWSAAECSVLHLALREDVALPAKLRFEFWALIAGGQIRRARLSAHLGEVAAAEFTQHGGVVAVDVEITEAHLTLERELDLVVEVDSLVSPAAATGAPDDRTLGLGLIRVSVVAAASEGLRGKLRLQRRRVANLVRRVRVRLQERGFVRGGVHLVRAGLRRLF
jgi:hypothetical protein